MRHWPAICHVQSVETDLGCGPGAMLANTTPGVAAGPAGVIVARGGEKGGGELPVQSLRNAALLSSSPPLHKPASGVAGAAGSGGGIRVFSGHLQFDSAGRPLYLNAQSLDELLAVVAVRSICCGPAVAAEELICPGPRQMCRRSRPG